MLACTLLAKNSTEFDRHSGPGWPAVNSTGCDDDGGPVGAPTETADSLLTSRPATGTPSSSARRPLWEGASCCSLSGADEDDSTGDAMWLVVFVVVVGILELIDWEEAVPMLAYSGSTCMEPYCRAAISCGERGRDLRRSFWRRFWNHICKRVVDEVSKLKKFV